MAFRVLTAFILGLALTWPARALETLRVLTWPGYADSDLVKAFEKQYDVRVEVSFVGSDDVLREKIGAASDKPMIHTLRGIGYVLKAP